MTKLKDVYCKTVAKSLDNPFEAGVVYKYDTDLGFVYDGSNNPHAVGLFGDDAGMKVFSDFYDPKSTLIATFVEV